MNKKDLYKIDKDISIARTLDSSFYTDKNIFKTLVTDIFSSTWQYGLHINQIRNKNIYPINFLPETLSESITFTRQDEQINCISNVCTHRGHIICDSPKKGNALKCRYHGRVFNLDGKMKNAIGFEGAKDFPSVNDNLDHINYKNWNNFLFFSLNKTYKNLSVLSDIDKRLSDCPFKKLYFSQQLSNSFEINTHWAMYCENYLEGFHVPFVHKGLAKEIDNQSYNTERLKNSVLQYANKQDSEKDVYAPYYWIFPNLMLNFYNWGLSINVVEPISINKTRVNFFTFPIDGIDFVEDQIKDLIQVELEDQQVVESVCRGVKSKFYSSGRYSPKHEKGVHYFHQLLSKILLKNIR